MSLNGNSSPVLDAFEVALRPFVPLLVDDGLIYDEVAQLLRNMLLMEMAARLNAVGRPATASRLALMAGINVSTVAKVLEDREKSFGRQMEIATAYREASELLGVWNSNPQFCTPYGATVELSMVKEDGYRSFSELVGAVEPTSSSDVLLDLLVTSKCAELVDGKFLRCLHQTFNASATDSAGYSHLGKMAGAIAETISRNIRLVNGESAYFERNFETDFPISDRGRELINRHLRESGQKFLEQTYEWTITNRSELEATDGMRSGASLFFFDAPTVNASFSDRLREAMTKATRGKLQ